MSGSEVRAWSVRGPMIGGVIALVVLLGGFGSWAAFASLRGAVIAPGQVEVELNRQVVQHPDGGVVAEILVREGDVVATDDVLIRLDGTRLSSELAVVEGQLFEVLARRARFEAERDDAAEIEFPEELASSTNPVAAELMEGQRRLFAARAESEQQEIAQLQRRAAQIADQITGIEAQRTAIARQLSLIAEELADQQQLLDRGLAQAARVLQLRREEANLLGRDGELAAAIAQAEGRITEIDIEILRIGTARREEANTRLRDLQFNEIELAERRRSLIEQLSRLDIRAPVGGAIYGMQVFAPRSVIRPADPVLFIVPQDRPLIITAQVQPTDIDLLFPGQAVTVRLSAFDQRRTPELTGRVTTVSADAFTDQASRQSYYRAQIVLEEGEMERLPEGLSLIPGMPVEAFVQTNERTPLDYLLKPLSDYFAKVFRET